jgi:ribosome-binding protein aMBF1 (putative translation factor)
MEQNDKVLAKTLPLSPTGTSGTGAHMTLGDETMTAHQGAGPASAGDESDAPGPASNEATVSTEAELDAEERKDSGKTPKKVSNNVRRIRIERMMSKAELARRANLSVLTIDRVERGYGCRMDTKRKILEALGLSLADRVRVFGEEE